MRAPLPSLLLVLALVEGTAASAQPAPAPGEVPGARHIILQANAPGGEHVVRIGLGRTTTFLFDTPLQPGGVVLKGDGRVSWALGPEADMLSVLPLGGVEPGQRLGLTVRFADGQAPATMDFRLELVEPAQATPLVNVYRPPLACAPYSRQAEQAQTRAFQCQVELAQVLTAQRMMMLDGLVGMLASGILGEKGIGVLSLIAAKHFTQPPEEVVKAKRVTSYRARGRVAAELRLWNTSEQPWLAKDAELVGPGGARLKVLRVWQPGPIAPGEPHDRVVVEVEATEAEARGPFLLRLTEENGSRSVTLDGVMFP